MKKFLKIDQQFIYTIFILQQLYPFQSHLEIFPTLFFISFLRNYIKLNGGLHPTLGSLGHFLFTNINFLNFQFTNDVS